MKRVVEADLALVVDDGYELAPGAVAAMVEAIRGGAPIVTGAVRFHADDDLHSATWVPSALTPQAVLSDPRGVPPAWGARAVDVQGIEPDASLGALAFADLWLRALYAVPGSTAVAVGQTVAQRAITAPTRWKQLLDDPEYPAVMRRFLSKHRETMERVMRPVLVDREVAFGRLRARHRQLIAERDSRLRELDELRAAAAHHRAFLAHHRLDGLDWGSLDRTSPIARDWGYERGGPVDRRYIREFVASHSSDVRGRVLEVQEDDLARAYGGSRVGQADVLDVDASNPRATIVADLRCAPSLPSATYDCIVLTQTAHVIDDMDAVMRECFRLLKPGGVLLATFPCVSRVCLEYGPAGDFWRVTPAGARALVDTAFGTGVAEVRAFGNVKTTIAFLHGLGEQELGDADYAVADPYNPMLVGVRAQKFIELPSVASAVRRKTTRGVVLAYHRIAPGDPDRFDLSVPPALFREHVAMLQRRGAVVPLRDLLALDPSSLPERAVALTFDDGYLEHLTVVAPLLREAGVPATFFITTAALETGGEHWWDLLGRLNPPDLRRWHDDFVNATPESRQKLLTDLRNLSGTLDKAALGSDPKRAPNTPFPGSDPGRAMTAGEVRELAGRRGMTIGAHGANHLLLPRQAPDVREQEMRGSRAALEAAARVPVTLFAYPYGGVDDATAALARQVFDFSCDCTPSAVGASFDAARVPRLDVKRWTVEELEARIDALYRPAHAARIFSFLP